VTTFREPMPGIVEKGDEIMSRLAPDLGRPR
jgi:hypothetical protein